MSHSNSVDPSCLLTEHGSNLDNIAKIVLIGETGAGKSTFINYLFNYLHKGNLNNLKIATPCKYHPFPTEQFSHNELHIHDNTQSKTRDCTQYMFTDPTTSKQYIFLDTPGLSDTHGIEYNESNINKMIDAITKLGNLTSVIILLNGSISRLTIHLRTIIACLNGNIPDVILENVIVILTNVKKHESPFDLKVLNLHGKVYPFYMQNDAFVSDPQTWKKSIRDELQHDWDHSMNQIKLILETIDSFKQVSIDSFIQLKQIRNDIKSIMHQARLEMIQIQKIQDELSQLDIAFKQADRDTNTYQDHTRMHAVEKLEVVDAPHHSTLCANCNQVCHDNCRLNETKNVGAQIISQCLVMLNGRCQQCPNHCSYINHYHAKKTIQITHANLYDVLIDLKTKYDQAYVNRNSYQEKILTISETKEMLEKTLKQQVEEIKTKSLKLCQICSEFNLAQEFKYLIKQLKSESNLIRNLDIKLQTEYLIKHFIKFTHLVEENQEKNRQKRPSMQIIDKEQSIEEKPTDIKYFKTADLIKLYQNTIDHSLITLILNELHQRAQGKSTDPLLTSNEIMIINKNLEKYNHKNIQQLSYSYRKLQQQIHSIIGSDILKIVDINPELLIENFIVQTLLDDKEKNENNHPDTLSDITPQPFPHSMTNAFPQPTFATTAQPVNTSPYPNTRPKGSQSVYPPPYPNIEPISPPYPNIEPILPLYPNKEPMSPPYPKIEPISPPYPNTLSKSLETKTSNTHSISIGFSHLTLAPYPSPNDPSPMPALPDDYSPMIQDNKQQSNLVFRSKDQRHDSADAKNKTTKINYQDHMPIPMPINNQQQSTSLHNSNDKYSSHNIIEHQRKTSSNQHSSIPDVIPFNGISFGSSNSLSIYLRNESAISLDNEDFRLTESSRLLLMYADANLQKNTIRKDAIYQELERRCDGDYPLLMIEKKDLFQEKIKLNEMKTIGELVISQVAIKRTIREYLKNNDFTLINDIPSELIIELHALNQLILSKGQI